MKNVLSTLAVLAVFALWLTPAKIFAQTQGNESSSVSISVNARVLESIELKTSQNMRFGKVQPGQREINISPIKDPNAGKMEASGIPNARIRVSFLREWKLTSNNGTDPITFYYRVAGNSVEDQNTAELLETDNRDLRFNSNGKYYFWIGGQVNITDTPPGNYEGEFTIEIEYI